MLLLSVDSSQVSSIVEGCAGIQSTVCRRWFSSFFSGNESQGRAQHAAVVVIIMYHLFSKMLYSCYIVEGSPSFISCSANVSTAINHELWPAFEDLFDSAEEYVLGELMVQWLELCELEQQRFEKVSV